MEDLTSSLKQDLKDYREFVDMRKKTSNSRTIKVLQRLFGRELQPSNAGKLRGYERTFSQVTGSENGIANHLARISESGRKPVVLDLMSNGAFVQDLAVNGYNVEGVSVGLATVEDRKKIENGSTEDETPYINGDIADSRTWAEINKWLEDKGVKGFDMVICRPIGAAEAIKGPSLNQALLNKMWKVTNPDGGMVLSEFSSTDQLKDGAEKMKADLQTKGVDMRVHKNSRIINSVVALVRKPNDPVSIV